MSLPHSRWTLVGDGVVVTVVAAAGLIAMVVLLVGRDRRAVAVLAATALGSLAMIALCAALALMVLLVVGRNRRAVAVLAGTASGSLLMVAICALAGIKINFLDFVALPIALGLGIDYAINVAERADRDDPLTTLRSTGGTVFVCSLTTMIGYASLLVSSNLAIRGFGLASLIGEITCVVAALTIVPAIVRYGSRDVFPSFLRRSRHLSIS